MGPSQGKADQTVDLSLNHPKFQNAKLITADGKRSMETTVGIDEKDYDKWKTALKDEAPSDSEFLLLPQKHSYSSKGLCGSSGTATVYSPLCSSTTRISLTCSAARSKTAREVARASRKGNSGTCCMHWPTPRPTSSRPSTKWATSGPATSSSTTRAKSRSRAWTPGLAKSPTTPRPSKTKWPT